MKFIKKVYQNITSKKMSPDYAYLAKSVSLGDVEHRQRQLQRGLAPHQRMAASRARSLI
jgi:hypothetical protein